MAVGCNQLCRRVCALQCGGGLVRRSSRPRAASGAGRAASPDGAGVALRRRALAANTEGLPADVKSKLVLGLSCVAEGLHVAFLSEFDYAGEELRS